MNALPVPIDLLQKEHEHDVDKVGHQTQQKSSEYRLQFNLLPQVQHSVVQYE